MPVHEFLCQQCGTLFEQWVASFNAIGEIRCPQCSSSDLKRKFSIFAARTGGHAAGRSVGAACSTGGT
jgi:putative FmdB family regulatory protein